MHFLFDRRVLFSVPVADTARRLSTLLVSQVALRARGPAARDADQRSQGGWYGGHARSRERAVPEGASAFSHALDGARHTVAFAERPAGPLLQKASLGG